MISRLMRKTVAPTVAAIHHHPFNQELLAGTLDPRLFEQFLEQDVEYLLHYDRSLSHIHERLNNEQHRQHFKKFSAEVHGMLNGFHYPHLNKPTIGLFQHKCRPVKTISAVSAYIKHLVTTAQTGSIEEAVASVAPCYMTYSDLAEKMAGSNPKEGHPYKGWIESYANETFNSSAKSFMQIVDTLGQAASPAIQKKMVTTYKTSTELELALWEQIYSKFHFSHKEKNQPSCTLRK